MITVGENEIQVGQSGEYINILDPDIEKVNIYDIAHALSNTGRYAGHCKYFYSVGQHSVLGSYKASSEKNAWDFLLHDASEGYIVDMPSPMKVLLKDYKALESIWEPRMSAHFNVEYPFSKEIKTLDIAALATERRDLLHPNGDWAILEGVTPWPEKIDCWHPIYTKYRFLLRVAELRPDMNIRVPNKIIPMFIQGMQLVATKILERISM